MEEIAVTVSCHSAEIVEDYQHPVGAFVSDTGNNEFYTYINAATCPDCGAGMVRLGGCFSCPSCGFATCSA